LSRSNRLVTSTISRFSSGSRLVVLGKMTSLPARSKWLRLSRIASRYKRLRRFRRVALPYFLETRMPYENVSAGCQTSVKKSVGNRCPSLSNPSISTRLFRLRLRGRLFLPTNLSRQPFPAFGATSSQHFAAVLGRHSGAETVIVKLLAVRWLKCSFHSS
jgi:hypothetical protein